jgi:hypothetical protein
MHDRPENLNFWPRKTQLLTGRPVWRALVGDPCDSLIRVGVRELPAASVFDKFPGPGGSGRRALQFGEQPERGDTNPKLFAAQATVGSMRIARLAGRYAAASATSISRNPTPINVSGSVGVTPKSRADKKCVNISAAGRRVTPPSMDATKQSHQLMRFAVVIL